VPPSHYDIPAVAWDGLTGRLERVAIDVVRLDARLEASGLGPGWQSRCDLTEAVKALILDGELVDLADLVLHDAGMDIRSPTHELTRAAGALRARRTVRARPAPWPISIDGLSALRGGAGQGGGPEPEGLVRREDGDQDDEEVLVADEDDDPMKAHLAEIDALIERTSKVLAGETPLPKSRSHLIYDLEKDEAELEDTWLEVVQRTAEWPAVAAAAIAWDAWLELGLYQRQPWLGLILAGAVLRARDLTTYLLPLAAGYRETDWRAKGRESPREKIEGFRAVVEQAVALSHKDLDRLSLARDLMSRVTQECRRNSKLPELASLFLSRPLVTMPMASKILKVTPKAFDLMMVQLGGARPRELTGRSRYRAWGIV
jgi:hypothetical protein